MDVTTFVQFAKLCEENKSWREQTNVEACGYLNCAVCSNDNSSDDESVCQFTASFVYTL